MADLPVPKLLAFIICDQIYADRATGKSSLLGIFSRVAAGTFPTKHERLCVHVATWNGHGTYKARLDLMLPSKEENRPILSASGDMQFPDPLVTVVLNFEINNLVLPFPGEYEFRFYCNDELIASRPFSCVVFEG